MNYFFVAVIIIIYSSVVFNFMESFNCIILVIYLKMLIHSWQSIIVLLLLQAPRWEIWSGQSSENGHFFKGLDGRLFSQENVHWYIELSTR